MCIRTSLHSNSIESVYFLLLGESHSSVASDVYLRLYIFCSDISMHYETRQLKDFLDNHFFFNTHNIHFSYDLKEITILAA